VPSLTPTLAIPKPEKTKLEALIVPLEEEVVLPIAKTLFKLIGLSQGKKPKR
jgi:hypothetical protein